MQSMQAGCRMQQARPGRRWRFDCWLPLQDLYAMMMLLPPGDMIRYPEKTGLRT
jgi:hypothetical protein